MRRLQETPENLQLGIYMADRIKCSGTSDPCCWQWPWAKTRNGYGRVWFGNRLQMAHRVAYQIFHGEIPHGLFVDHLCRNRECWNPAHLDAVTHAENVRRGEGGMLNRGKTHCPQGHAYDANNTYVDPKGKRRCRICKRAGERAAYARLNELLSPTQ